MTAVRYNRATRPMDYGEIAWANYQSGRLKESDLRCLRSHESREKRRLAKRGRTWQAPMATVTGIAKGKRGK